MPNLSSSADGVNNSFELTTSIADSLMNNGDGFIAKHDFPQAAHVPARDNNASTLTQPLPTDEFVFLGSQLKKLPSHKTMYDASRRTTGRVPNPYQTIGIERNPRKMWTCKGPYLQGIWHRKLVFGTGCCRFESCRVRFVIQIGTVAAYDQFIGGEARHLPDADLHI